jgi:hypothetical protein
MKRDIVGFALCWQSRGKTSDNTIKVKRNGLGIRGYVEAEDRIWSVLSVSFVDMHIVVSSLIRGEEGEG